MAKKKRKMSPAQKAALAKGRKALAAKRKDGQKRKTKKKNVVARKPYSKPRKRTAAQKVTAKRKTVKRSNPPMAKKKKSGGGLRRKASSAARRARGFLRASGAQEILMDAGTAVAGGVAAGFIANQIPIANAKVKSALPIVGGILLATTIGKKNKILRGVGTGMVVLGAVSVIKQIAPQVPMLAGETDYSLLPDYSPEYGGEMVNLGQDEYEDEIATMGETVDLGEDIYVSPASI